MHNAQSLNNRLKQSTVWKQLKVPDLVDRMSSVTHIQQLDLRRALHGAGNCKLYGKSIRHLMSEHIWHGETQKRKKKKAFIYFLTTSLGVDVEDEYVHSSEGTYKCEQPRTNVGRKPGQRKHQKAERASEVKHR